MTDKILILILIISTFFSSIKLVLSYIRNTYNPYTLWGGEDNKEEEKKIMLL